MEESLVKSDERKDLGLIAIKIKILVISFEVYILLLE